jgi:predicted dehydrogenase
MIGLGLVGAGIIAEQHANACADLSDRIRITAVADVSEDNLRAAAAKHAIPNAFTDHRALVECDDVDVVAICTPPCFHEQAVVDALEAGKLVLCEKPVAHTLEITDRIVAAARSHPGRLSFVHQFRYLPEVRRAIWLRDHGRLGTPLYGRFSRFARFNRPGKAARREWWGAWQVAGGGAVMTQLVHELDLMCHIFGDVAEVSAMIDTLQQPIESEDSCAATVRFRSGAIVSVLGTMNAWKSMAGFDVIGSEGSTHSPWRYESVDKEARAEGQHAAEEACPEAEDGTESSDHTAYYREVLDAIDAGEPLPIGPEDARRAVELATAIYASALTAAPISLPLTPMTPCYGGITNHDYDGRSRPHPEPVGREQETTLR